MLHSDDGGKQMGDVRTVNGSHRRLHVYEVERAIGERTKLLQKFTILDFVSPYLFFGDAAYDSMECPGMPREGVMILKIRDIWPGRVGMQEGAYS